MQKGKKAKNSLYKILRTRDKRIRRNLGEHRSQVFSRVLEQTFKPDSPRMEYPKPRMKLMKKNKKERGRRSGVARCTALSGWRHTCHRSPQSSPRVVAATLSRITVDPPDGKETSNPNGHASLLHDLLLHKVLPQKKLFTYAGGVARERRRYNAPQACRPLNKKL